MASTENKSEVHVLDLNKLNVQQLSHVRQQLDQELSLFQESLQSLKIAQTKFQESKESLDKIKPDSEDNQILVPLTGSMYVPGRIKEPQKFIIDIGTGYYIEKDLDGAKDYFKRKVSFVTEQMEKIQAFGLEKSKLREVTTDILEAKVQQVAGVQKLQSQKS